MNVLVTHADEPIGRRIIKTLFHDDDIAGIFAIGSGAPPRSFDRYLAGSDPRLIYSRIDLAKHRPVTDLFHSGRFRGADIDTVVHVPHHGAIPATNAPLIAGLPSQLQAGAEGPSPSHASGTRTFVGIHGVAHPASQAAM